jgi:hypothetical protein
MGIHGGISVNGKQPYGGDDAKSYLNINLRLMELYLDKFEKRGAKREKYEKEKERLYHQCCPGSFVHEVRKRWLKGSKFRAELEKTKEYTLYKKEVAKLGKIPSEQYFNEKNDICVKINLELSKNETKGLIDALEICKKEVLGDIVKNAARKGLEVNLIGGKNYKPYEHSAELYYINSVIKALRRAMKNKSKIKFNLENY